MKRDALTWDFEEQRFMVGESITEPREVNAHMVDGQLLVFHKKRLYLLGHASCGRCCLRDLYTKKAYWTRCAHAFRVLRVDCGEGK